MQKNRVMLNGYVGNHLATQQLENGGKRVAIRVATHDSYKDKEGNWVDQTTWHDVIAWDKKAEYAERNFVKGSRIQLEGCMEYRTYPDKMGHIRYIAQVKAFAMENLDR